MAEKTGEVPGALHHKDIGDIDLVWGIPGTGNSDGMGLSKIVEFHPEVLDSLQDILDSMHVVKKTKNRINLESDIHKGAIRLEFDGEKKTWLLTAFEKEESLSGKSTVTSGTLEKGKQDFPLQQASKKSIPNNSQSVKSDKRFSIGNSLKNSDPSLTKTLLNKLLPSMVYL